VEKLSQGWGTSQDEGNDDDEGNTVWARIPVSRLARDRAPAGVTAVASECG
jgi:hypothetical protein